MGEETLHLGWRAALFFLTGFILSFCPQSLNNKSLITELPLLLKNNVFFLETDEIDSFNIMNLYAKISEILNVDLQLLKDRVFSNFKMLFKTVKL